MKEKLKTTVVGRHVTAASDTINRMLSEIPEEERSVGEQTAYVVSFLAISLDYIRHLGIPEDEALDAARAVIAVIESKSIVLPVPEGKPS